MMGIIALSGIVVNNGLVLLDYSEILLNRKKQDISNSKKKLIIRKSILIQIISLYVYRRPKYQRNFINK